MQLTILAGGATLAVGTLAFAATTAYASPLSTSGSVVDHSPALVVPHNYHPAFSVDSPVPTTAGAPVQVAPESAVDLADKPEKGLPAKAPTDGPSGGHGPSGDSASTSNSGNDLNNKGTGSNKSTNNGNDMNNKGTDSNKSGKDAKAPEPTPAPVPGPDKNKNKDNGKP